MKSLVKRKGIPQNGFGILTLSIIVSLLLHLSSLQQISRMQAPSSRPDHFANKNQKKVKVKIVQKPKTKPEEVAPKKQIVEAPQEETAKPTEDSYLGKVDHIAKEQTKVLPNNRERGQDAGFGGNSKQSVKKTVAQEKQKPTPQNKKTAEAKEPKRKRPKLSISDAAGVVVENPMKKFERNQYEQLLSKSYEHLQNEVAAGYQDYIDDEMKLGDRIDINTTEFRYLGYFSSLRKSIELVWNYPMEAIQKGLQGKVGLEFSIMNDGSAAKIRVIKSSGYKVLDDAIVDAIELASPFSPLPKGFGKEKIIVSGNFHYQLNAFSH